MLRRSLAGRVVLVTGASAGIGRVTVERLARRGARVVACARRLDRLEQAFSAVPNVTVVPCDVRDGASRQDLVERALREHGRIDSLVNNAGIGWLGLVEDMPQSAVDDLVRTNLLAVIDLTRLVLPGMLHRRDGDVVMMSSIAAWSSVPPLTVYCATKFGVDGFLKGLRREVSTRGVRVHSVNPGPVRTEWLARAARYQPAEGEGGHRLSQGVPPELVAYHVERCLRSRWWSRTAAVPRVLGLTRLGEVTPVNRLLDVTLSPVAPELGSWGRQQARERAEPRDAVDGASS